MPRSDSRYGGTAVEVEEIEMRKSDVSVQVETDSYDESPQQKSGETVTVNMPEDYRESVRSDAQNSKAGQRSLKLDDVLSYYVDRFSMHGLGLLVGSQNRYVKVIWSLIIFFTILEVIFYIRSLVLKYLEYPTRTESSLAFSNLQFPAVTVCNANIMKKSMVPPDMVQAFTESMNVQDTTADNIPAKNNIHIHMAKRSEDGYKDMESEFYGKLDANCWEAVADKSESYVHMESMKNMFSSWNVSKQRAMGHQADQMIMSCTFATRNCFRNFIQRTNEEFGNCYTIEDTRFISKQSGPLGGLELKLDLETDEYVSDMSATKGAQIVIHPPNTVPLPGDEGITIPSGQQVMIGLKEIKKNRLGEPYSPCINPDEYKKLYNVTYTRKLCQKICYIKRVADKCDCLDNQYSYIDEVIHLSANKTCVSQFDKATIECILRIKSTYDADDAECNCLNPCSEVTYDIQIGYKVGHDKLMLDTMVERSCINEPEKCDSLRQKNTTELRENYVFLNIYFRDLNYEQQEERKNYDINQLLSDFGGIMGLFIGLSFVSLLELTHMAVGLACFLLCRAKQRI